MIILSPTKGSASQHWSIKGVQARQHKKYMSKKRPTKIHPQSSVTYNFWIFVVVNPE